DLLLRGRLLASRGLQVALRLLARALRRAPLLRRREVHPRAPRLREADRDRLLRRARAVLAATYVLDLLAHVLARLRGRSVSAALVLRRSLARRLPGHGHLPRASRGQPARRS